MFQNTEKKKVVRRRVRVSAFHTRSERDDETILPRENQILLPPRGARKLDFRSGYSKNIIFCRKRFLEKVCI